jgi:signal transduction histidine kinase
MSNRGTLDYGPVRVRGSILLACAFAALLLVIGLSALAIWRNAKMVQARVAALHSAHVQAAAALASIRTNVLLNSILVRDYLLDFDPSNAQQYIDQFSGIRTQTDESFRILDSLAHDDAQKAALSQLRRELEAHWNPTEVVLDWTPEEKHAQRTAMLRQRLRRRNDVIALAERVEHLMSDNYQRERQRVTTADQEFRESLSWTTWTALLLGLGIAGVTLTRLRTLERRSQAAQSELRLLSGQIRTTLEQERKHLSRELHDQVGQMLTGLRMELTAIARVHGDSASEVSSRIAHAKGTVEQTLRIVRNIAMLLRPSMLDDLGLTPALAWLVKELSRSSGMEIHSEVDPELDSLPETLRTCVYRVVQEALTNASRHSGAKKVEVALKASNGWVIGSIVDDGRGFETEGRPKGLGLLGMEERVKELGGNIRVESVVGQAPRPLPDRPGGLSHRGTLVEFRLPNPPASEVHGDTDPDRGRSRHRPDGVKASA